MLFNSSHFLIFFLIVYSLYLLLNHKWQNRMLLVASYVFYGFWNWRFLFLIFISTVLDYACGKKIYGSENIKKKRAFLFISLFGNLSILWLFKYYNFFAASFQETLKSFGFFVHPYFLNIILPVGISFYTFKTLSYTIDIYRNQIKPTQNFLDYALFIAFFPQLVAGPIERAAHFLPQISSPRKITLQKFSEGCFLIFWGLFKKVFIADSLGQLIVDPVFSAFPPYNGVMVLLTIYAYTFQMYCDFSGYTDMSRGLSTLMGFEIVLNFNLPFFSTNVQEFWNRWHISLSSWVKDYIYIPLFFAMNKMKGMLKLYISLIITMVLLGFWHGARWTYIVFGLYYGILLAIYAFVHIKFYNLINPKSILGQKVWFCLRVIFMFQIISLGMLIFRADSMAQAFQMLHSLIFNFRLSYNIDLGYILSKMVFFLGILWIIQFLQYWKNDLLIVLKANSVIRAAFYYICFYLMIIYGVTGGKEFIYFQF